MRSPSKAIRPMKHCYGAYLADARRFHKEGVSVKNPRLLLVPACLLLCSLVVPHVCAEDKFTIAVLPDVQQECSGPRFKDRMTWLVNNRANLNLKMMLQVGDMMNFHLDAHYQHQSDGLKVLDNASFPYALAIGNHDTAAVRSDSGSAAPGNVNQNLRNTTKYNAYFPTTRFQKLAGTWENNKIDNAYHTFTAGGLNWLVINLELWARTAPVDWAKKVADDHPNHNVVIITHAHLNGDSTIQQNNGGYGDNSPQFVFDRMIKQCANVRLVFSGHVGSHGYRTDKGVKGNTIYQFLQCYHDNTNNPTRLVEIDTKNGSLKTWVYSPSNGETKNDGSNRTVTGIQWVQPGASKPASPTGLKATPLSTSQIKLTWTDNSGNESGFKVERKTGSGGTWSQIATPGANTTGFTSGSLNASTTYYYRVRAYNSAGDSSYSNEAYATTFKPAEVGNGNGLLGEYYAGHFSMPKFCRTDGTVDFNWGTGSPASSIPTDNFSVFWSGQVQAQYSETYTFTTLSDDGVRLWVDGQLIVDNWTDHAPTENSGKITLTAGHKHHIMMNYYERGGGAVIKLYWSSPSTSKRIIPQSQLYCGSLRNPENPTGTTTGLNYAYYTGNWSALPDFSKLSPAKTGVVSDFNLSPRTQNDYFAFKYTGFVDVPYDGTYAFYTNSDDGSQLYIGDRLVVNNDFLHGMQEKSGALALRAGKHALTVLYFERAGSEALRVSWAGPSFAKQGIPVGRLLRVAMANGDGLFATYFNNENLTGSTVTRIDKTINFDWGTGAPVGGIEPDTFSVRWTGSIEAPASGTYTFTARTDDGVRLWINGQQVLNNWTLHSVADTSGTITLTGGQRYSIKMEYYEGPVHAVAQLYWSGPGIGRQIVPQKHLYSK